MRGTTATALGSLPLLLAACAPLKEAQIGTCLQNEDGSVANPSECGCANGLDDDEDGKVDCGFPEFAIPADLSCITTPVCQNRPGDSGDSGPGDGGDTGSGAPLAPELKSFAMTYLQTFELVGLGRALCGEDGFIKDCECRGVWQGDGALLEAVVDRNLYDGTWDIVEDDCEPLAPGQPSFSSTVWVPENGQAYHSHWFIADRNNALGNWAQWVVHGNKTRFEPDFDNPTRSQQFFALFDNPPALVPTEDGYEVTYVENRTFNAGPGVDVALTSEWRVVFSKDPTPPDPPEYPPRETDTGTP